jgi:hypothetical protein
LGDVAAGNPHLDHLKVFDTYIDKLMKSELCVFQGKWRDSSYPLHKAF